LNKDENIISLPGLPRAFLVLLIAVILGVNSQAAVFQIEAQPPDTLRTRLALEYHHDRIAGMLDIEYTDTIRVVIATTMESFNRALGTTFPDWGAAAAVKKKKLIVIKSPSYFQVGKSLEELLGHELGHLMLDKASAGRWLPRWFEEGFCQLVSGEWRISNDIRITRAVWGGGLMPLTSLEDVNKFGGAKAGLAYSQSYLAVSSLVQELSIQFIPDFLNDYRETGNIYNAFFTASGYKYTEWANLWQKQTVKRYRFVLFVFESDFFFPMLAVLIVLLYIMKKFQVRKKRKRWELEERLQGYEKDSTA